MLCGSALCSRIKQQHNERRSLWKTNSASTPYKETRIPALSSSKEVHQPRCTSTHSVHLHIAERVYQSRNNNKTDKLASPNTGQTRTNAGPDKANKKAGRKTSSKNIPNASSNHADTNPAQLDVSCAISNDRSLTILSKRLLPIIKLQVSTDFQKADCLTLCDSWPHSI